jgi:arylsulfatase A-like enzyme
MSIPPDRVVRAAFSPRGLGVRVDAREPANTNRFVHEARRGACLLLAGALALCNSGCGRRESRPKNVLLITIDTCRADCVGAYGHPTIRTPALDQLAREGVLFTNARAPVPMTLPSHTSIMTGLYPRTHLVLSHAYTLGPRPPTLAQVLKEHGYTTAAFVSSHVLDKKYGLDRGFDIYWERWTNEASFLIELREQGKELVTKTANLWLRETGAPFFAWVHYFQPHKPYEPPAPLPELYDPGYQGRTVAAVDTLERIWRERIVLDPADLEHLVALYEGEVTVADMEVAKVLAVLEETGHADDTIVIVTADHGEVLYEHEFYFGHDIMLYGPALDVPMIVKGKGLFPPGRIVTEPVRLIDLAPTILEALGIPPDEVGEFEGRSLLPVLAGPRGRGAPRGAHPSSADTLYAEVFPPKEDWKVGERHAIEGLRWKLILDDETERRELYDLVGDPGERSDLSAAQPETAATYFAAWDAWKASKAAEFVQKFPDLDAETIEMLRSLGYIDN